MPPADCSGHVLPPDNRCSITATPHPDLPFGLVGAPTVPGNWGVGYFYLTSLTTPAMERTQTVIFATFTITSADCGAFGNSCAIDLSGSLPGNVDPYIVGAEVVLVNMDNNTEREWFGPGTSFDDISVAACDGNTYPNGQPFGSWSLSHYAGTPVTSSIALVATNSTRRPPTPPPPPPLTGCVIGASMNPLAGDTVTGCIVSL